jgi:endonuclease-3
MEILRILRRLNPHAHTALDFSNPLELLVATILSAQCTDVRVNRITPLLFKKYRNAADYAAADPAVFQQEIRTAGFFRQKTAAVIGACKIIAEKHGGRTPDRMQDLVELPGVARKTANVVLGSAMGKNEGVAVDTHVRRVAAQRLGLSPQASPEKIEQDLMKLLRRKDWTLFSHLIIDHGRKTCTARKPHCPHCPVNRLCPWAFKVK